MGQINSLNIVILTGAGISRESGLHTFRDADGIWAKVNLEDVATPDGFRRNPHLVHDFYNARRASLADSGIQPNAAHWALAELEAGWRGTFLLITQNIDDLHERAGSKNVVHMHGELLKVECEACGCVVSWLCDLTTSDSCSKCGVLGSLRPHVVWFGEVPLEMDRIQAALENADLFVSIGTSGTVYPAANFVRKARASGAHTTELNLEPSDGASLFDKQISGLATIIVPAFVERLLEVSTTGGTVNKE